MAGPCVAAEKSNVIVNQVSLSLCLSPCLSISLSLLLLPPLETLCALHRPQSWGSILHEQC